MALFLQGFFQTPCSHGHLPQDQNMGFPPHSGAHPVTQQDSAVPLSHSSQGMGKRLCIRPVMDSSWQVGIANLTKFGALFSSPPSLSGSASSHSICGSLFYSCTCSICVQLHAGTSLQFESLSWWPHSCLSLTWLITVMLTASQLVAVTASAQVPCQVSAKHSQCCFGDSCS